MRCHLVVGIAYLAAACTTLRAEDLSPVAFNSILDRFRADGFPDEVRNHARDYVFRDATLVRGGQAYLQEARTYVEFKLAGQAAATRVTLEFDVGRYNTSQVADQVIDVAFYLGNGKVELDDWLRPAKDVGATAPIKGFNLDEKNLGEAVPTSLDVTAQFNSAVNDRASHVGFSFRKRGLSVIDPGKPGGYSGLNTIGKCRLRIEHQAPPAK